MHSSLPPGSKNASLAIRFRGWKAHSGDFTTATVTGLSALCGMPDAHASLSLPCKYQILCDTPCKFHVCSVPVTSILEQAAGCIPGLATHNCKSMLLLQSIPVDHHAALIRPCRRCMPASYAGGNCKHGMLWHANNAAVHAAVSLDTLVCQGTVLRAGRKVLRGSTCIAKV